MGGSTAAGVGGLGGGLRGAALARRGGVALGALGRRRTPALVLHGFFVRGRAPVDRDLAADVAELVGQRIRHAGLAEAHLGQAVSVERDDLAPVADEAARLELVPARRAVREPHGSRGLGVQHRARAHASDARGRLGRALANGHHEALREDALGRGPCRGAAVLGSAVFRAAVFGVGLPGCRRIACGSLGGAAGLFGGVFAGLPTAARAHACEHQPETGPAKDARESAPCEWAARRRGVSRGQCGHEEHNAPWHHS